MRVSIIFMYGKHSLKHELVESGFISYILVAMYIHV